MNRILRRLFGKTQSDREELNSLCRATRKSILGENRMIEYHLPFLMDATALCTMEGHTKVGAILEELEDGAAVKQFMETVDPDNRFHKRPTACGALQESLDHWLLQGLITNQMSLNCTIRILSIRLQDNKELLRSR